MTDIRYWLWLAQSLGEGARFKEILADFGSVEALYNSNILERRMSPALTSKQIERLAQCALQDTEEIVYQCAQNGWDIIGFDDERYPQRLREIANPPAVLFVEGTLPAFDELPVLAVVGTRKASPYAVKAARVMAQGTALCGMTIVSGGAIGVDAAAYHGALAANSPNYCVLGCGFGAGYLSENRALRQEIVQAGGALITEYPPFTPATKYTFPLRNRIISGLSLGVLVVEAGVKSGSLITAKYAQEQNRDVFALASSIFDEDFYGCNRLIEDGAVPVTSVKVLLEAYGERYPSLDITKLPSLSELLCGKKRIPREKQPTFDNVPAARAARLQTEEKILALDGNEKIVCRVLTEDYQTIEEIIAKSEKTSNEVLAALTLLEMKGLVQSATGKRYRLKG